MQQTAPLVELSVAPVARDFSVELGDFSSTTATIAPTSDAGRALFAAMFGAGVVSVNVPKSKAVDFARFVAQRGLTF